MLQYSAFFVQATRLNVHLAELTLYIVSLPLLSIWYQTVCHVQVIQGRRNRKGNCSLPPPHILFELKSKNCSIKRHCNYLPLDIFRPQLALLLDLVHMHIVFLKVCLPLLPLPKKPRQFELQIQLIRKSGLNIAF